MPAPKASSPSAPSNSKTGLPHAHGAQRQAAFRVRRNGACLNRWRQCPHPIQRGVHFTVLPCQQIRQSDPARRRLTGLKQQAERIGRHKPGVASPRRGPAQHAIPRRQPGTEPLCRRNAACQL
ncbi:hypothetical protein J4732_19695, partial [Serratia marcescens]|nr:hypothetical protein [Serratia marcescens]